MVAGKGCALPCGRRSTNETRPSAVLRPGFFYRVFFMARPDVLSLCLCLLPSQAAGYTIGQSVQEEILEMIDREADGTFFLKYTHL